MTKYMASAGTVRISPDVAIDVQDKLKPAVYNIVVTQNQGIFLQEREPLPMPAEIYGASTERRVTKVLTTFKDRKNEPTGVLLSGLKGSGKSMLARLIAVRALAEGYPVILLQVSQLESDVVTFFNSIDTQCIVLLEELDKTEGKDKSWQIPLLQLLDGSGATANHLFLATANDAWAVSDKLMARPGRIYYHFHFGPVSEDMCREYIASKLPAEAHDAVYDAMLEINELTFDTMRAFVEEVNRYGYTPELLSECLRDLNIKDFEHGNNQRYKCSLYVDGTMVGRVEFTGIHPSIKLYMDDLSWYNEFTDNVDDDDDAARKYCAERAISALGTDGPVYIATMGGTRIQTATVNAGAVYIDFNDARFECRAIRAGRRYTYKNICVDLAPVSYGADFRYQEY